MKGIKKRKQKIEPGGRKKNEVAGRYRYRKGRSVLTYKQTCNATQNEKKYIYIQLSMCVYKKWRIPYKYTSLMGCIYMDMQARRL